MEQTNKIPGVTFHVITSSLRSGRGSVNLDASVEDSDLWENVVRKLEGFRVYTVDDLNSAFISVLQTERREEREAHTREVLQLREELERAKQRLSVYEENDRKMSELMTELQQLGSLDGV